MPRKLICLLAALIAVLLVASSGAVSFAASTSSELAALEDRLAAATASRKAAEGALKDAKTGYADALATKKAIDNKIYSLDVEIEALVGLIDGYGKQIEQKNAAIDAENVKLEAAYQTVRQRIRAKHEEGGVDFLSVIFESDGLVELFSAVDRFLCMLDYDARLLGEYNASISALEDMRAQLTATTNDLNSQMTELEARRAELEADLAEAKRLVVTSENKLASAEKDLASVEEEENRYSKQREALLAELAKTSNQKYVGGEFLWPLPQSCTRVSSGFGYRIHPVTGKPQHHNGIDIPAPYGTEIYAVNDGTVVECSYNYADGYYITVSHGGGIASFYSHLSRYRVNVGDKVTRGQVIANVGTSGYTTGAHLNLNVYENNVAVDPMKYFK